MAFEDDTSVENTSLFWDFTAVRTGRKFYLNLVYFKVSFVWEETSKLIFFSLTFLTKSLHMALTVFWLRRLYAKFQVKLMVQSGRKMQL